MPIEYDKRRPRIPVDLAAKIDEARDREPFNSWVVRTMEGALGSKSERPAPDSAEKAAGRGPSAPAPPRSSVAGRQDRVAAKRANPALERQARLNEAKGLKA